MKVAAKSGVEDVLVYETEDRTYFAPRLSGYHLLELEGAAEVTVSKKAVRIA
jgi:hypothetical protein